MSTRDLQPLRRPNVLCCAWLTVGVLVLCGFAFGASLSPWVILGIESLVVAIVDLIGLAALARRSTRRTAITCGAVGLTALVVQAAGLYLSTVAVWTWLSFSGSGWLFWTFPALAVSLAAGLLVRRATRLSGWAVLIGSAEGFLATVAFVLAAFAACNCWD
jgi:hypothetical protein